MWASGLGEDVAMMEAQSGSHWVQLLEHLKVQMWASGLCDDDWLTLEAQTDERMDYNLEAVRVFLLAIETDIMKVR